MAKRPITIQLEPELIRTIDEARGQASRQAWIADACRAHLPSEASEFDTEFGKAAIALLKAVAQPVAPAEWQRRVYQRAREFEQIVIARSAEADAVVAERVPSYVVEDATIRYGPVSSTQAKTGVGPRPKGAK